MKAKSVFSVTLSDDHFNRLQSEARTLHVPVKWLVASLVCDTFDSSSMLKTSDDQSVAAECRMA